MIVSNSKILYWNSKFYMILLCINYQKIIIHKNMNTLALETIYDMMLKMSYSDLLIFCQTNSLTHTICNDRIFWLTKLDQDFTVYTEGGDLIPSKYVMLYGDVNENGRSIYKRWMTGYNINFDEFVYSDDFMYKEQMNIMEKLQWKSDIIIWLLEQKPPTKYSLNNIGLTIAKKGNPNLIQWLLGLPNPIELNTTYITQALIHNNIIMARYLANIGLYPDNEDNNLVIDAMYDGYNIDLSIFEFMGEYNIYPNGEYLDVLMKIGRLDVLQWVISNNPSNNE